MTDGRAAVRRNRSGQRELRMTPTDERGGLGVSAPQQRAKAASVKAPAARVDGVDGR